MHVGCVTVTPGTKFGNLEMAGLPSVPLHLSNQIHLIKGGVTSVAINTTQSFLEVNITRDLVGRTRIVLEVLVAGQTLVNLVRLHIDCAYKKEAGDYRELHS